VPTSFDLVTFDAPDTGSLATFWCAALDLVEVEREDGDRWLVLASAQGRRLLGLQRGVTRPGSVHLDLACGPAEFDDELTRLVGLGARLASAARREEYGSIANLLDPDGNTFDLCAYT
jgi:predicted enzyme related to lactoylglutathione lyase